MPGRHECKDSDHISTVAKQNKIHDWERLWDANTDLRNATGRKNPNILYKGDKSAASCPDELTIPDPEEKEETAASDDHHVFVVPTHTVFLRLRILRDDFTAIDGASYELTVDGVAAPMTGTTDAQGQIEEEIPADAKEGTLTVRIAAEDSEDPNAPGADDDADADAGDDGTLQGDVPIQWKLGIGRLNPIMENAPDQYCVSGVQQRLNNLALNCGPVDGIRGPNTRASIEAFQRTFGLAADSIPGQGETQPKLVEVHDRPDSIMGPAPAPASGS